VLLLKEITIICRPLCPRLNFPDDHSAKDQIMVANHSVDPYETGLLIVMYCLSQHRRSRPDMERFFHKKMSHISDNSKVLIVLIIDSVGIS
jgi:hypothetical protein